eukprot:6134620-Lingulodinium_polyedra.AAC.1
MVASKRLAAASAAATLSPTPWSTPRRQKVRSSTYARRVTSLAPWTARPQGTRNTRSTKTARAHPG